MNGAPDSRIQLLKDAPIRHDGEFVLYWMTAARRTHYNFGLQHAILKAAELRKPLVVVEHLPCGSGWDSERHHQFMLGGMADNARRLSRASFTYYPYLERKGGEAVALVAALADLACMVVCDYFPQTDWLRPCHELSARVPRRLECVDSNGLLPLSASEKVFSTAYSFRRFLQSELPHHLPEGPSPDPLSRLSLPRRAGLPAKLVQKWPPLRLDDTKRLSESFSSLPINHSIPPVSIRGGAAAARRALSRFLRTRLSGYHERRNHPDDEATSNLSAYLHFGHISAHEIFRRVMKVEGWSLGDFSHRADGRRSGWWRVGEDAEAFLDQLITWRELGFNFCSQRDDYDQYHSLPAWARSSLETHSRDFKPHLNSQDDLEAAQTHDRVWNAAQMQLVTEGRMHNYLRMVWGKKILEWSPSAQEALEVMIELNNKYALDGRDPNSYTGILWVLGRYDRPWGPERPIFGKIRYMSSENTVKKLRMRNYLAKFAP